MTYRGKVKNGVIVLEGPAVLPEGAEVSVRALKRPGTKRRPKERTPSFHDRYKRYAGAIKDMPPDSSVNLDHYLYGAPKEE